MNTDFHSLCQQIVAHPDLHCRWLNTLSLMENTGARKIAHNEDPIHADLTMLKHAAEEFRHAFYLKKMIGRIDDAACPTYESSYVLAPHASRHYLHRLDVEVCRLLIQSGVTDPVRFKTGAYLLVTYAIEVRADSLYGTYQNALDEIQSKVNVKSIIAEEEGHLQEMQEMLTHFDPRHQDMATQVCAIEARLYDGWLAEIAKEVELYTLSASAVVNTTF
jgi:hypothetical protein